MIRYFSVIKNIGVFKNYETKKTRLTQDFKQNNFIFGLNTYGKSTLCDILKDLNDDQMERVTERVSIPQIANVQKVVICRNDETITLDTNGWKNNTLKGNILVFDTEFVFQNVFDGSELTEGREARENFTEFILGENGVRQIQEIEKLKKELKKKKERLKNETPKSQIGKTDAKIKGYARMALISDIQKYADELENKRKIMAKLVTQKSHIADILHFGSLPCYCSTIQTLREDYASTLKILETTFEISQNLLEKYQEHLNVHFTNTKEGAAWLSNGIEILSKNDSCPFCGQPISDRSIINLYASVFNEDYTNFVAMIKRKLDKKVLNWNVCLLTLFLTNNLLQLKKAHALWEDQLLEEETEMDMLLKKTQEVEKELNEKIKFLKTSFNGAVQIKRNFPIFKTPLQLQQFNDAFNEYEDLIYQVNSLISVINKKIETIRKNANVDTIDKAVEKINMEINTIQIQLTRHEENEQCKKWMGLYKEVEEETQKVKELIKQLEKDQKDYLDHYFDTINDLFQLFGGRAYRIERGDLSNKGYKKVQTIKVLFYNSPVTKTSKVFSESDKRALALAIFIAKILNLRKEECIKKILVFDDPVTSFDENRMRTVIMKIKEISNLVSQTFILGHHYGFASEVFKRCEKVAFYQLQNMDCGGNGIYELDTKFMFANSFLKEYMKINAFINGGTKEVRENDLRVFLEEYLRIVFAKQYKEHELEKEKFGKRIDVLAELNLISEETKKQLHIFRCNLNPGSHEFESSITIEDNRTLAYQIITYIFEKVHLN